MWRALTRCGVISKLAKFCWASRSLGRIRAGLFLRRRTTRIAATWLVQLQERYDVEKDRRWRGRGWTRSRSLPSRSGDAGSAVAVEHCRRCRWHSATGETLVKEVRFSPPLQSVVLPGSAKCAAFRRSRPSSVLGATDVDPVSSRECDSYLEPERFPFRVVSRSICVFRCVYFCVFWRLHDFVACDNFCHNYLCISLTIIAIHACLC